MKKKILALLCSISLLTGMTTAMVAAEEGESTEVTQNVVHTIIGDTKHGYNFCGQYLTNYGSQAEGLTADMSYNGTSSYKFSDVKSMMRYMAWTKDANNNLVSIAQIADVKTAIETGNAYICGWFYAEKGEKSKTIQLIAEGADKSEIFAIPNEEWTFVSAKITNFNSAKATNGVVDTNGTGSVYIDDLCIVTTSDGSAPVPTDRVSVVIPTDGPNRYTKTLMDIYTDGFASGVYHQHAHVGSGEEVFDMVKSGEKALKITNEYYFGFMDQLQNISDELKDAINSGNAYISAWLYMDTKIDENAATDVYYPTGMKGSEGQWKWVCGKLGTGMLDDTNMLFKSKNRYTYLDDVKIVTFTDAPQGVNYDSYSVTGAASETTVNSLSTIGVDTAVYNNSTKTENMTVIIAEYDTDKVLVSAQVCEVNKALPFREASFSDSYTVSANSGNTVKVFMWNMADGLKDLQAVKEFTIN